MAMCQKPAEIAIKSPIMRSILSNSSTALEGLQLSPMIQGIEQDPPHLAPLMCFQGTFTARSFGSTLTMWGIDGRLAFLRSALALPLEALPLTLGVR